MALNTACSEGTGYARVLQPDVATVFSARADRLRALASTEASLSPFLALLAKIVDAQQSVCSTLARSALLPILRAGPVPLGADTPLPDIWLTALRALLNALQVPDEPIGACIARLGQQPPEVLQDFAVALLSGNPNQLDRGDAALLAAALQVVWTAAAAQLDPVALDPDQSPRGCPACGSAPVSSVLLAGGNTQGLRYLCCSLCSTQWNLPRIRCVWCGASGRIGYYHIQDADAGVRAEACDDCKTYTKILDQEKHPGLESFADDMATLGLDVMMAEAGYARFGLNPFLLPGAERE
ncbi:formate dehydrogenase accessory protein FdhE [Methylolobus aquaticus]